ncbi:hypothetical protein BGZ96_004564 [Linnemannia gamsii]|uniref:tRNA(Ile)-lysidine synthetase n=1 Tax=Linnemannia gamsii TaxID=64522 RepID=A0ABQ7K5G9_9FUNG|nr:hypothetical protein BGZ96_004564 [Linnemannia gamsii]
MFSGFSAWLAPELRSYKQTWGQFQVYLVCYRPTMKILRPDWIEDSIRGQKRLSLKRYKSVFPGLARFDNLLRISSTLRYLTSLDSTEHGNMAVGMDAFNSTNVISLDKSWQPHQPEPEIQDLSVTPSSGATSRKSHPALGSVGGTRTSSPFQQSRSVSVTTGSVQTITLTKSDPDKAGNVGEDEDDIVVRDELEDDSEVVSLAFLEHPSRSSSEEYNPSEQDLSSDSMEDAVFREDSAPSKPKSASPEAIPPLLDNVKTVSPPSQTHKAVGNPPRTRKSTRPPAQTHDSQVSDDFFASSDDELAVSETNGLKKISPQRNPSLRSFERADTMPLSPRDSLPLVSFHTCEDNKIRNNKNDMKTHTAGLAAITVKEFAQWITPFESTAAAAALRHRHQRYQHQHHQGSLAPADIDESLRQQQRENGSKDAIVRNVGIAVSGGVDSMALATLLARHYSLQSNTRLHAFIVDHKLRNNSTEEANYVAQQVQKLNVVPHVLTLDWSTPDSLELDHHSSNFNSKQQLGETPQKPEKAHLETKARLRRYKAIAQQCYGLAIEDLFVGHHAGDQVETTLFRFSRASGIDGLAGVQSLAPLSVLAVPEALDIRVVRPLLHVSKVSRISIDVTVTRVPASRNCATY